MGYTQKLTNDVNKLDLIQYMKKLINESNQKGACIDLETNDGFKIKIEVKRNE